MMKGCPWGPSSENRTAYCMLGSAKLWERSASPLPWLLWSWLLASAQPQCSPQVLQFAIQQRRLRASFHAFSGQGVSCGMLPQRIGPEMHPWMGLLSVLKDIKTFKTPRYCWNGKKKKKKKDFTQGTIAIGEKNYCNRREETWAQFKLQQG